MPGWSTTCSRGRPLMALWAVRRKVPGAAGASLTSGPSWLVCHCTRSVPVSLVNDSVCVLSWPDQDPSGRHSTTCFAGGGGRRPEGHSHAPVHIVGRLYRVTCPPIELLIR